MSEVKEVIKHEGDKWILYSADGTKKLGEFNSEEEAKKREGQINYFKHQKEALQREYSDLVFEFGQRNAKSLEPQVKKLMECCKDVLDGADESRIDTTLEETKAMLLLLREQTVSKLEEGEKYPALAYAYTPDVNNPTSWKLRLWEGPQQQVTKTQLNRAAAMLSPGGLAGQKAQIPFEALAEVKRKIRADYARLGVADEDIPKWVKENEVRTLISEYTPLAEAAIDAKGKAQVVIIKPGFNATKERFYPAEMLARDYKVFEGVKMYADHPTEKEEKERPERSIKDWVATLSNVRVGESGAVVGDSTIIEPWMREKMSALRDTNMLSEMGVSINAVGTASKAEIQGHKTVLIERLVRARSVDYVTEAGAGGGVTFYESGTDASLDVDIVSLETLKDRRPDLIKILESGIKAETQKEVRAKMALEQELAESKAREEALTKERDALKGQIEKAEQEKVVAAAQAKITEAVGKTDLPDAAKKRLVAKFSGAASDEGVAEAIKTETDYIATIREAGKVKGMGDTPADPKKAHEILVESFVALGLSKEQAEIAARGR